MKRWILILALLLLIGGGCTAYAAETLGTGACGTGVTWSMTRGDDGLITLAISGNGAVTSSDWEDVKDPDGFRYQIDELVLNEGITAISDSIFCGDMTLGAALKMPSTLKSIGRRAFLGTCPVSLSLNEGLESIGEYAFDDEHCCPAVIVPKSVKTIGYRALPASGALYVYPGTEGEQWCKDWNLPYEICNGALSSRQKSMKRLLEAVSAADDVPLRYRQPVIDTLKSMNGLTAAQLDSLADYVTEEYATLRRAMADNDLNVVEISGFVSRFMDKMIEIGVNVSCAHRYYGDYPGVRLTVTVNGESQTIDVYRNMDYWYLTRQPKGATSKYTWRDTDAGLVITGYSGSATNLTVPATLNGKNVIGVEGTQYNWPAGLVNLELPEGLKFVGQSAFSGLDKLVNVHLPDSLESIQDYAFSSCDKLTSITFGPNLKRLGAAFYSTGITHFDLPASLEYLGRWLPSVTIDPANTHFKKVDGALYNEDTNTLLWAWGSEIPSTFTVKEGTRYIRGSAFTEIMALKKVILPSSMIAIGDCAFEGCGQLETVTLNEGLESIGEFAFQYCDKLYSMQLPSTLVELGYSALEETQIGTITIPKGLFAKPDQLMELKRLIKEDMQRLYWIDVAPQHPLYTSSNGMLIDKKTHTLLFAGQNVTGSVYVPDNVWAVGEEAFEDCEALTGITFPAGLTSVGVNALSGTGIVSLSFPDSVKSIAFQQSMHELLYLSIPASVTELGYFENSGFNTSDKKTTVAGVAGTCAQVLAEYHGWDFVAVAGSGITGFQLFVDGKPNAGTLTIWQGDVVEVLADNNGTNTDAVVWDFGSSDNKKAAQVLVRDGATLTIGGGAAGTSTYTVHAADNPAVQCQLKITVKALSNATPNCFMLPAGLKEVEANAFRNTAFRYVCIPDGTTTIGSRAFMNCKKLKVVRVPDSIKSIAVDAFQGCEDVVVLFGELGYDVLDRLYDSPGVLGLISWKQSYIWMPPWLVNEKK